MDLTKITSKGQVIIPADVRKKLVVKKGDNILFIEEAGRIYILNSSMGALREVQAVFTGDAERAGLKTEGDVNSMAKEIQRDGLEK